MERRKNTCVPTGDGEKRNGRSPLPSVFNFSGGRDSVVGIMTRYGVDGPGLKIRWG